MENYATKYIIFISYRTRKGVRWCIEKFCDTLASANCECNKLKKLGYNAHTIQMYV